MEGLEKFCHKNAVSVWFVFIVVVLSSTMMHPTFASLLDIILILLCSLIGRHAAKMEGRYQERLVEDKRREAE